MPVLATSVAAMAAVRAGELWVDCTLGFGGHAEGLLQAGARVIGIDQDPQARAAASARLAPFGDRFRVVSGNFRHVRALLDALGVDRVDGLLADIGVSSWQLDAPERGFSFSGAGPVDMRMNPEAGETALQLIERLTVPQLADRIRRDGEEDYAGPIARAIKVWAEGDALKNTATLASAVAAALPRKEVAKRRIHPATLTFQALRIAVNDELGALDDLLDVLPEVLATGGRGLLITFHSLEDRRVKQAFAALCGKGAGPTVRRGLPLPEAPPPAFEPLSRKVVVADEAEIGANPRSRSARLRGVRHLGDAQLEGGQRDTGRRGGASA